jgi:hypothetical protein
MILKLDEYLNRMPEDYKEKYENSPEIILDIFNTSEVVTWSSSLKNSKYKLLPCRCGITYSLMPAEQYDEIMRINKYFQKLYIIDKKKLEIEKDFE